MDILISGASTGIGRASALHMARLGHTVWAGVRSQKDFDSLTKLKVDGIKPVFLDVTDEDSVNKCVSQIKKEGGSLNGLVNNAGVAIGGPVEGLALAEWQRQFDINFFGVIRLTKACLPMLRESKGRIVNMSSLSGRISFPFMGPYGASKFALEGLSDSLRREVQPFGVKVALIEPGAIATPIWEKAKDEGLGAPSKYSKEVVEAYGPAMKRFTKKVQQMAAKAAPVSVVTKAVEHALLSRGPSTRYPVGRGTKATTLLLNVIPDQLMDRVFR